MSELEKLTAIVASPNKAFDAIRQRPTWVLPLALFFALNLLTQFVLYRVIATDANFDQIARAKIEWDARAAGLHPTQSGMETQIAALRQQRNYWYAEPLIGVPLSLLPMAVFFYILLRLVQAGTTFRMVFSVLCWSFVIYRGIGGVFIIAALLIHGAANFFPAPPEAWSPTSMAQLVSRSAASPNVYSAISKLDLFLVWWLAVLAIGFSRTSRSLSLKRSTALVATTEIAYLVFNAAGWLP